MINSDIFKNKIRYLTNEEGQTTDVLIPLTLWEDILKNLDVEMNPLDESKTQLIADFKESLIDAKQGDTFPLEELWEDDEI